VVGDRRAYDPAARDDDPTTGARLRSQPGQAADRETAEELQQLTSMHDRGLRRRVLLRIIGRVSTFPRRR
jgi:hypothetical protein